LLAVKPPADYRQETAPHEGSFFDNSTSDNRIRRCRRNRGCRPTMIPARIRRDRDRSHVPGPAHIRRDRSTLDEHHDPYSYYGATSGDL